MVPPHRPVVRPAAARRHLARYRRDRPTQALRDRTHRLAIAKTEADLLAIRKREPRRPGSPHNCLRLTLARSARHPLHGPEGTADLNGDLANCFAVTSQLSSLLPPLPSQVHRHREPPGRVKSLSLTHRGVAWIQIGRAHV